MKKWILALIVAGLLLGGGLTWALLPAQAADTPTTTNPTTTANPTSQPDIPALTDAQKQQLQDLDKSRQDSEKALQDQLQQALQQLKDALVANPTDTTKLQQAQATILSLEDQLATSRTDFALKAKEITGGAALGPMGPDMEGPKGCGDRMGERRDRLEGRLNSQDGTQTGTVPERPALPDFPKMKDGATTGTMPQRLPDPDLSNLKDELGVTDAQITQLQDLRTSTASAMQQLRDQMQTAEKDLRDAIQADPTDTAKLQTAQTTLSNLRAQQLQSQVNIALQAKQIVGPDIFAKAVDQFGRLIDFIAPFQMGQPPFQMGQRPDKGIGPQAPQPTGSNSTLTDTQKQQLQDLRQQEQDSTQALAIQLKDAAQQLKDALVANPTDTAKLQQAQVTMLSLENQLAQMRNNFLIQAQQIAGADALQTMEGRVELKRQIQGLDRQIDRLEEKQDRLERIQDHPGMVDEIQQNLGLTDDQLLQLKDLRASAQTKMEPIQAQMQTARETLDQAFQANPIDAAQVQQAQAQVDALRGQILQARLDEALQIKALVGAEAFAKLLDTLMLPEMGPRPF
ncbi:MAG: periplasmic heavy metal sensor [Coprothermobacterota bacterium]|nr:periplasmic heavy metal sensor [Coprothermobacterota bacterium]